MIGIYIHGEHPFIYLRASCEFKPDNCFAIIQKEDIPDKHFVVISNQQNSQYNLYKCYGFVDNVFNFLRHHVNSVEECNNQCKYHHRHEVPDEWDYNRLSMYCYKQGTIDTFTDKKIKTIAFETGIDVEDLIVLTLSKEAILNCR